jgi:nucleoside-diphosphate-sugar epimerase
MRILVTGAGGFIGGHLCPALAAAGHELRGSAHGCDAVVHLANIAHTSASPAELHRVNVEGTIAQAKSALAAGARRFVYLSSLNAARPDDAYGRAKAIAEQALLGLEGLDAVILRPPLVYGPRVKANFLALMRAIDRGWPLPLASVANRRSLVYVGNLVDAILRCLRAPAPLDGAAWPSVAARGASGAATLAAASAATPGGGVSTRIFELSDGAPVSTAELCHAIARALGKSARPFPFPPSLLRLAPGGARLVESQVTDDAAIRTALGWRPPFTFEQGLQHTAQWYRAQGR